MRRYWKQLAILACVIAIVFVGWWLWPEDLFFPQLKAATGASAASLSVGANVHVSKPHASFPFTECIIAADPNHVNRLFAASMFWPRGDSNALDGNGLVGYLSDDGGKTWTTSLELVADGAKKESLGDPTAVFGPDGDLYFVHMRMDGTKPGSLGQEGAGSLDWLCLPAGPDGWEKRGRIDRAIDRPWLAVDHTSGPNRGRLYCTVNVGGPGFITSPDGGRTFRFPKVPCLSKCAAIPAQPVILLDGSLFAAFRCTRHRQFTWQPQYIPTFRSNDGGQSLTAEGFVSNWKHPHLTPSIQTTILAAFFPQLAVDPGSARLADNLYIVWPQGFDNRRNTEWILFSRSTDRGKTWSAPVNLSEQPETDDPSQDYIAYIPCIAVNKAGVIAVTWYDRRGLPGVESDGSRKGWNLRMRVSLDGGATWPPSVLVTSQGSNGKLTGWHTAGLSADAAGDFHPAWIDDRSGKPQLWTTRVTVN